MYFTYYVKDSRFLITMLSPIIMCIQNLRYSIKPRAWTRSKNRKFFTFPRPHF